MPVLQRGSDVAESCFTCHYAIGHSEGLFCERTGNFTKGYKCWAYMREPGADTPDYFVDLPLDLPEERETRIALEAYEGKNWRNR